MEISFLNGDPGRHKQTCPDSSADAIKSWLPNKSVMPLPECDVSVSCSMMAVPRVGTANTNILPSETPTEDMGKERSYKFYLISTLRNVNIYKEPSKSIYI